MGLVLKDWCCLRISESVMKSMSDIYFRVCVCELLVICDLVRCSATVTQVVDSKTATMNEFAMKCGIFSCFGSLCLQTSNSVCFAHCLTERQLLTINTYYK